jgi:hypothetical protein
VQDPVQLCLLFSLFNGASSVLGIIVLL